MRALLGILLCITFLQSQVYALSGGPVYNHPTGSDVFLGNYSGAMIARRVSPNDGTSTTPSQPAYISAIGIFATTVSTSAATIGSGRFIVFNQGVVTRGSLDIVPVISNDSIAGVLEDDLQASSGTMQAKLVNRSSTYGSTVTAGIRGDAQMRFTSPLLETIDFKVVGYQTTL